MLEIFKTRPSKALARLPFLAGRWVRFFCRVFHLEILVFGNTRQY